MISILIIGNEILSAQVEDVNLKHMLGRLNALSYVIDEVRIVRDEVPLIADAIRSLSRQSEFVISTGGVGPTHDDVTYLAYAMAFGQPLEMNPTLVALLQGYFGNNADESSLRMALVPANTTLVNVPGSSWPLTMVGNCFVLPGLPEAFFKKFDGVMSFLPKPPPLWFGQIYTRSHEVAFATVLAGLQEQFPAIEIGSYPTWNHPDYAARVTFKGREPELVSGAFAVLKEYFRASESLFLLEEPAPIGPLPE